MSRDDQQQIEQGTRLAASGTTAGVKLTARLGKSAGKALLSRRGRILLLIFLVALIIIAVLVQGVPGSSFRRVYRQTAVGEDYDYNNPETDDEAYQSIYDPEVAVEDTMTLVDIIHNAKQKDLSSINDAVAHEIRAKAGQEQYTYAAGDVDIDLSIQMAKKETAESGKYAYVAGATAASSSSSSSEITILMVDDDDANQRVVRRLEKQGAKVKTVKSMKGVDIDKYDALVIPGGNNVDPSYYGEKSKGKPITTDTDIKKDKAQGDAVKAFAKEGKPILGICRGCQLMNAALGGTIDQGTGDYHKKWHKIKIDSSSLFYPSFGKKLNCWHYHKQQVKKLAPGFKATMWSTDKNGTNGKPIIEAIEHESKPWYGLQWHCDVKAAGEDGDKAFAAFIDAVKKNKGVSTQVAGVSGAANTKYKVNNPAIQRAVDWAIAIANDDSFCYGLKDKNGGYASRCGCYFCGTNDKKVKMSGGDKRYYKTYVCMTFVHAAYAHGAGDPAMLKDCKRGTRCISAYRKSLKSGANQYGCWAPVGYTRNLKASDLQPGDVLIWPGVHMAMYLDNTHIVDAGGYGNGWGAETIAVRKQSWKGASYVIRYTGQGGPTGTTAAARKEYKKITTLKTLDPSTGKKVNVSPVAGNNFQSFAYAGKDIYLQSVPTGETGRNGYIYKCGANGKISSTSENLSIGHGNGLAYCTKDSTLYSVTVNGIGNNKKTSKIDPKALKITGTKSLKHGTSSIAYDRTTDRFITSSGAANGSGKSPGYLYVYDSDLKTPAGAESIKKLRWKTPGDIAAYGGVIYVTVFSNKSNHIDMYSEDTGGYLGSYDAPYDEIEGVDFDENGQMVLLFNASQDYLQFTGIKAETNSSGESAGSIGSGAAVTKLDMDILSAYNISVSNTSMYLDKEKIDSGSEDGWLDDKAYTDVTGKKLKLYWFGKNRGMVNYERDLDSKVDALIKGDAKKDGSKHFFKITIGTNTESVQSTDEEGNIVEKKIVPVTIKEAEADTVMESMFGLKPDDYYANTTGLRKEKEEKKKDTEDKKKTEVKGTANNLEATYSLSDNVGRLLFGELVEIQNPYFDEQADMAIGAVAIGAKEQQAILDYINKKFPPGKADPYRNGWAHKCLGWCANVYNGAGIALCAKGTGACCASAHREAYAIKKGNIPPGALIYNSPSVYKSGVTCGSCGRNAGHIAIYLGNGKIAGSQPPYIITLEQWNKTYGYGGWSFGGNSFTDKAASAAASSGTSSAVSGDKIKSGSGSKKDFQAYARSLLKDYGWSDSEFEPLKKLWNKESGWNPSAHNPSGAHGIPQALPAKKMAKAGADYYTNGYTQIRWGLQYIKDRYGSPSAAWNFSQKNNWY